MEEADSWITSVSYKSNQKASGCGNLESRTHYNRIWNSPSEVTITHSQRKILSHNNTFSEKKLTVNSKYGFLTIQFKISGIYFVKYKTS